MLVNVREKARGGEKPRNDKKRKRKDQRGKRKADRLGGKGKRLKHTHKGPWWPHWIRPSLHTRLDVTHAEEGDIHVQYEFEESAAVPAGPVLPHKPRGEDKHRSQYFPARSSKANEALKNTVRLGILKRTFPWENRCGVGGGG